jgi:argininosuccinate lyase
MSELLRKGRLSSARKDVARFTSSAVMDKKILKHIVAINKAHVTMLIGYKSINENDGKSILEALTSLEGKIELSPDMEDGHTAVEEAVAKAAGQDVGGNLNLAKSRNDQVATALRMETRNEILETAETLTVLQDALLQKAEQHVNTIIPGYTHLQPAQPITFAHYLVAQFDAIQRTVERLQEGYKRINLCPMGACALATTSFPINRQKVADLLGFDEVLENTVDAVTSRDFILETLADLSILAVDVTRFVEDLEIWSTAEFGVVELPDEFAFTSSIMPQKKNPDILEVIRSRMSLVLGNLTGSTAALLSLPSTYNMDYQEVTPKLWESLETAKDCVSMLAKIVPDLKVSEDALRKPAYSFMMATELANMLVRNYKVPFRASHTVVGAIVKTLLKEDKSLNDVTPELIAETSKQALGHPINVKIEDIRKSTDPSLVVESYGTRGGPAPKEVKRMMAHRTKIAAKTKAWVSGNKAKIVEADERLNSSIQSIIDSN